MILLLNQVQRLSIYNEGGIRIDIEKLKKTRKIAEKTGKSYKPKHEEYISNWKDIIDANTKFIHAAHNLNLMSGLHPDWFDKESVECIIFLLKENCTKSAALSLIGVLKSLNSARPELISQGKIKDIIKDVEIDFIRSELERILTENIDEEKKIRF